MNCFYIYVIVEMIKYALLEHLNHKISHNEIHKMSFPTDFNIVGNKHF